MWALFLVCRRQQKDMALLALVDKQELAVLRRTFGYVSEKLEVCMLDLIVIHNWRYR
ncbi:hypothetical protein VCHA49P379_10001 [Vibrio chagasii]|nr:hypothetical protein VCHA34P115_20457 [Vibrio chagasii]CAH7055272.1 hypothetical protein VCHA49P379_10001 [Vibrio chagasii]CAH7333513.1 hypothetical protein VCHA51O444_30014 [Vibrio chagasii]